MTRLNLSSSRSHLSGDLEKLFDDFTSERNTNRELLNKHHATCMERAEALEKELEGHLKWLEECCKIQADRAKLLFTQLIDDERNRAKELLDHITAIDGDDNPLGLDIVREPPKKGTRP